MLVSVCVISYNQEAFIAEALDSILAQRVDFDIEIVISDDYSTDDTPRIIEDYSNRFPDVVRFTGRTKNVGCIKNFFENLAASRGQYVALLDGDDYWTDDRKLERQISVLEAEPDLGGVFHDAWIEDEASGQRRLRIGERKIDRTVGIHSLILEKNISTSTMTFRNCLDWSALPEWALRAPVGDYPLALLVAGRGPWRYLPEVMSVYRSHGAGVWGGLSVEAQLEKDRGFLQLLEDHWEGESLAETIRLKRRMLWRKGAIEAARGGDLGRAFRLLGRSGLAVWAGYPRVSLRKFFGAVRLGFGGKEGS
ncbi:MAG: glycosyltransferase [Acidobacteriota bacterium]|nr:glycosyltransferase [Acidobacteriota bacterium]